MWEQDGMRLHWAIAALLLSGYSAVMHPSVSSPAPSPTGDLTLGRVTFLSTIMCSVVLFSKLWWRNVMSFPHVNTTIKKQGPKQGFCNKLAPLRVYLKKWCITWQAVQTSTVELTRRHMHATVSHLWLRVYDWVIGCLVVLLVETHNLSKSHNQKS